MKRKRLPEMIPILISKGTVILPVDDVIRIPINNELFKKFKNSLRNGKIIGISAVINSKFYTYTQIERMGIACRINDYFHDGGIYYLFADPIMRINIKTIPNSQEEIIGEVIYIKDPQNEKKIFENEKKMFDLIIEGFQNVMSEKSIKKMNHILSGNDFPECLDAIADHFIENPRLRQAMLNAQTIKERLLIINDFLERIISQTKINLRKQEEENEINNPEVANKIKELELKLTKNLESSEDQKTRDYIKWLKKIPWNKKSASKINIAEAAKILRESHYGMEDTKNSIIEFLATNSKRSQKKGKILLLVGAPGVGKTSIVEAIAKSMKRQYVRLSLGGLRDEAEFKGHRRTYVGALPGKIISLIAECGFSDPVFLLDEIDKIDCTRIGNPSDALLELLDAKQKFFTDHYVDIPFDVSEIIFIATANSLENISKPLRDRMEVLELNSYTDAEKLTIAKNYILPDVLADYNFNSKVSMSNELLKKIIREYTYEAGVRELKRKIEKVISWIITKNIIEGKIVNFDNIKIEEILGLPKYTHEKSGITEIGETIALAVTGFGGGILRLQSIITLKRGSVEMTGSLQKVIEESMKLSINLATKYVYKDDSDKAKEFFSKFGIHIHAPEGATPKDGPSAGVAITISLISLLSNTQVKPNIAMTGEIDSYRRVLKIGGLIEKLIAAHRAGIKTALIPFDNLPELNDYRIPQEIKNELEIIGIKKLEEAIKYCFE